MYCRAVSELPNRSEIATRNKLFLARGPKGILISSLARLTIAFSWYQVVNAWRMGYRHQPFPRPPLLQVCFQTIKESVATSRDRHPLLDRCSVRYDKRRNKVLLKWTADCTHVHTAPRMNERMNAPQAERKKGSRGERERRRIQ